MTINALQAQIKFADVTEGAGIRHQFQVYEGMFGGGACAFDLDNDGFEDLYLTSGVNNDVLYLNQKDGTFKNIFEGSGLEDTKKYVTQGVAAADVNRDGWVDLFITTITTKGEKKTIPRAENLLFLNNGDRTFGNATAEFGLEKMYSFSTGGSFGDFNADGYPDLYVGNYFLEYDGPLTEINDATIVNASKTAEGYLLLNKKGKLFRDVYEDYGLNHRGFGFGGVFTDFDNDGDQDLLVNHDFGYKAKPNYLLRNEHPKKTFTYVEKDLGMDLRINAMGAAVGDFDNNGWLDYFVTNIKFNRFMVSGGGRSGTSSGAGGGAGSPSGAGGVSDFKDQAQALNTSIFGISWGANFADFDHDSDLDLFVANGDLNPNCTPMADHLFENMGGKFQEVGMAAGVNDYGLGRGSIVFDLENDGDLDLLLINQKPVKNYPVASISKLFRNDSERGNWLKVRLLGVEAETHGIGSRVEIVANGVRMLREIDGGGSSHLSQNSTLAHFGIGSAGLVDSVIVTWTGGKRQVLVKQATNQVLTVREEVEPKKDEGLLIGMGVAGLLGLLIFVFKFRRNKT